MTWVRIDDGATLHPKLLNAGPEAAWLWLAGLAHCNRSTTDGVIDKAHLVSLYPSGHWSAAKIKGLAERLCEVGLWSKEASGYVIHGYSEYQEEAMTEAVQHRRELARERKRRQRSLKKTDPYDECHAVTGRDMSRVTSRDSERVTERDDTRVTESMMSRSPVPSRPVPALVDREIEIAGPEKNELLEATRLEQLGFAKYGSLGGKYSVELRKLLPITGQEFLDASNTKGTSWGYFVKVVQSIREAAAEQKDPKSPRRGGKVGYHPGSPPEEFVDGTVNLNEV